VKRRDKTMMMMMLGGFWEVGEKRRARVSMNWDEGGSRLGRLYREKMRVLVLLLLLRPQKKRSLLTENPWREGDRREKIVRERGNWYFFIGPV